MNLYSLSLAHFPTRIGLWCMVLCLISLGLYIFTLPQDLIWGDASELAASAWCLGIPHPTGYPLYLLLLRGFQCLPFGTIAFRGHLFSAVCTSATVALLFLFLYRVLFSCYGNRFFLTILPAWAASAAFAFSPIIWSSAVSTEVYPLFWLLFVTTLFVFEHVRYQPIQSLPLFSCLCGLHLVHHRLSLFLLTVGGGIWLTALIQQYRLSSHSAFLDLCSQRTLGLIVRKGLYGLIPLILLLYFPLRALNHPSINWYDPISFTRFWQLISGNLYAGNLQRGWEELLHSRFWLNIIRFFIPFWNYNILSLPAIFGFIVLFRRVPWLAWTSTLLFFAYQLFFLLYRIGDWDAYLSPALLILTLPMAFGVAEVFQKLQDSQLRYEIQTLILVLVILCVFLPAGSPITTLNVFDPDFSPGSPLAFSLQPILEHFQKVQDLSPSRYALQTLNIIPPNVPILTGLIEPTADNEYYPLLYTQIVEKQRPDVPIIGAGFLLFDWYKQQVNKKIPLHLPMLNDQPFLTREAWLQFTWQHILQPVLTNGKAATTSYEIFPAFTLPKAWYEQMECKILISMDLNTSLISPSYRFYIPSGYVRLMQKRNPVETRP